MTIEQAPLVKTCEVCGTSFTKPPKLSRREFEKRRFCSRDCTPKGIDRPGRQPHRRCRSGRHEMAGANVRVDGRGHRACKACAAERDRERRGVSTRRATHTKTAPATAPPSVAAPPVVSRPVWRPAGFPPQPNTGRRTA